MARPVLTVATFLWHSPTAKYNHLYHYGPEHVYRMQSMLGRHIRIPHELVCATDMPLEGVRTVPLERRLLEVDPTRRFPKLQVFRPDAGDVFGPRILLLDLDTVIVDDLTPLVERPEPLVLWRNENAAKKAKRYPSWYNSSFLLLDAGARTDVYETFPADDYPPKHDWVGDQSWISKVLGPGMPQWDVNEPVDGLYKARTLKGPDIPPGARAVTFNGPRDPSQAEIQQRYPWVGEHWC